MTLPGWSFLAGVVAATGSHEPAEQTFVHRLVRPGDGCIDVGANLGLYSARLAADGLIVSAFEPNEKARFVLRANLEMNAPSNSWRIFPCALGDNDGTFRMTKDLESSNYILGIEPYAGAVVDVEVCQLDTLVSGEQEWWAARELLFLKVDAEGHDAAVLRGARQVIKGHQPVVLIETWAGDDEVREILREFGYRFYWFDLDRAALVEFPTAWDGQANLIAVSASRLDMVQGRLALSHRSLRPPAIKWEREGSRTMSLS